MNFMLISVLILATVSFFPTQTFGTGAETEEKPHALPLVAAAGAPATDVAQSVAGEIWQEDDREVLIRSARGANKNNGGSSNGANVAGGNAGGGAIGNSGSGKKEKQANKRILSRKNTEAKTVKKSRKFLFIFIIFNFHFYFIHFLLFVSIILFHCETFTFHTMILNSH